MLRSRLSQPVCNTVMHLSSGTVHFTASLYVCIFHLERKKTFTLQPACMYASLLRELAEGECAVQLAQPHSVTVCMHPFCVR
jgi:hypothetical protein